MNSIRYSDQENKIQSSDDGSGMKSKPLMNKRRTRVPLGGKDGNKLFPSLNRSKSTIDNKIIPRPVSRSSSTLGFTHKQGGLQRQASVFNDTSVQVQTQTNKSDKLEYNSNTIFNPLQANRSTELYQDDTDSLRKQIIQGKPPSDPLIFSPNTTLPASKSRQLHNVDPIKRSKISTKQDNYRDDDFLQKLINDENSIETGPGSPPSINEEDGLTEQDLCIFSKPTKRMHEVIEMEFNDFKIDDSFDMNDVNRDSDEELGLNENDLKELLD